MYKKKGKGRKGEMKSNPFGFDIGERKEVVNPKIVIIQRGYCLKNDFIL